MVDIRHAVIPLVALAPHPRNYRKHPDTQLSRIMASLQRFGQVRSIVVQEGKPGMYLIVAGHGVVQAAQEIELTNLHADIIPANWSPEQIEGYLIADNMSGTDDDGVVLAQLLEDQKNAGYELDALGWNDEELAALLEQLADDAIPDFAPVSEEEQGKLDEKTKVICPECGHEFSP